jgi:hypothetical protein
MTSIMPTDYATIASHIGAPAATRYWATLRDMTGEELRSSWKCLLAEASSPARIERTRAKYTALLESPSGYDRHDAVHQLRLISRCA